MIKLWALTEEIPSCYKTISPYQPLSATQCQITGVQISSITGWNLSQLFIYKGALE